jgi:hypothetical protein
MNTLGIVMMVVSYVVVIGLAGFCFFRVLTTPDVVETEHSPMDIDTKDRNNRSGGE